MRWIALAFQHAFLRGRAPAVTFPPRLLPLATAVPAPSNSGLCSVLPGCSASPVDVQGSPISPPLPSIETVLGVRVPTLRHVPKASRDAWAGVVGDICQTIVSDPTDLHSLASLLNDCSIPPESRCTLLVDFSNAFNSIDRGLMFEEARARIPSMSSWLECCYGSQPVLFLGEHTILSCCGVQQGDPLGPLGFAVALHPIVERINREVPGLLLNSWYIFG